MTLANCIKYLEEAKDEDTKKFWSDRIARKYPDYKKEVVKPKPKPKKEVKEDDSR